MANVNWNAQTVAWLKNKLPIQKTKHLHRARLYLVSPLPEAYQIFAVYKKRVVAFLEFRNDKEMLRIVESGVDPSRLQKANLRAAMLRWAAELMGDVDPGAHVHVIDHMRRMKKVDAGRDFANEPEPFI